MDFSKLKYAVTMPEMILIPNVTNDDEINWDHLSADALQMHKTQKAITRDFESIFTKIKVYPKGNIFPQPNLQAIADQEKKHLYTAVTQRQIYTESNVNNPADTSPMIQGMHYAEYLGRFLQVLMESDKKIMDKRPQDFRDLTISDMALNMNIVMSHFLRSLTGCNSLKSCALPYLFSLHACL